MDCTVLHYSAGTVHCEWIHCGLHCLVGTCVRLQLAGPKHQVRGAPPGGAHVVLGLPAWGLGIHNAHMALGLPTYVLVDQAHKWRLGSCLSAKHTPAPVWRLGYLSRGWAHPVHTWHLGCLPGGWAPPAHTWRSGCVGSESCMCATWGHLTLGPWHWAQGY
jgi:hypothetical protein